MSETEFQKTNEIAEASDPNTSKERLAELSHSPILEVRRRVARNKNTPETVLYELSRDSDVFIRQHVAENPSTNSITLDLLLYDVEEEMAIKSKSNDFSLQNLYEIRELKIIKELIAINPNASASALERLSHDFDKWVLWGVSRNPKTPKETLDFLSKSKDPWIRENVVRNPNTSQETLKRLIYDEEGEIREIAEKRLRSNNKVKV